MQLVRCWSRKPPRYRYPFTTLANASELRYPELERLAFALVISTRKLRHYFLAHPVVVLTNHPMKQVLRRPEASGRLVKWAVELTQFDIL